MMYIWGGGGWRRVEEGGGGGREGERQGEVKQFAIGGPPLQTLSVHEGQTLI